MVLIQWLRRAENGLQALSLGLIIGGAVGNIIDRFRFGAVVDYLLFYILDYHFPAFNLADAAISVGVTMLLYEHFSSASPSSLKFSTKKR
jgi:signal peptidase II